MASVWEESGNEERVERELRQRESWDKQEQDGEPDPCEPHSGWDGEKTPGLELKLESADGGLGND